MITGGVARARLSSRERGLERLRLATGLVVLALPLALGGAHAPVNLAAAVLLGLILLLSLFCLDPTRQLKLGLVTLASSVALGATLLQLLPLPLSVLSVVSPAAHELLASRPGASSFATLSLHPAATAHEVAKLSAVLFATLLALIHFSGRRIRELCAFIGASGALVVAVGVVHALADLQQPYGVFTSSSALLISSFVNANHQAGFLGLSAFAAGVYAVTKKGNERWGWLLVVSVNMAGVVLTLSRGGVLSLVFALVFVFAQKRWRRSEGGHARLWLAAGAAVLLAGFLAQAPIVHELWTLSHPDALAKTERWRPVPRLLSMFPVTGVGRGALSSVYPFVLEEPLRATVTHLENEPLQALVDWGLPVGLFLLVCMALALVRVVRRAEQGLDRQILAGGLLFLVAANLGDFSLTLTAVAVPAAMLLAAGSAPRKRQAPVMSARLRRGLVAATIIVVAAATGCGVMAIVHDIDRDVDHLRGALARAETLEEQVEAGHTALCWHPCDHLIPLLVADRHLRTPGGARASLRWINRGLHVAPHDSGAHWLLARALFGLGQKDQALGEYRQACAARPAHALRIASEVMAATSDAAAVAKLARGGRCDPLAIAGFLLGRSSPEAARQALQEMTESSVEREVLLAKTLMQAGDRAGASATTAALREKWPTRQEGYVLGARAFWDSGERAQALSLLELGRERAAETSALLSLEAQFLLQQKEPRAARKVAQELAAQVGGEYAQANAQWLIASTYTAEGRDATAAQYYQRARELVPSALSYRLAVAACRLRLGDHAAARAELNRARLDFGDKDKIMKALAEVEDAARGRSREAGFRELVLP